MANTTQLMQFTRKSNTTEQRPTTGSHNNTIISRKEYRHSNRTQTNRNNNNTTLTYLLTQLLSYTDRSPHVKPLMAANEDGRRMPRLADWPNRGLLLCCDWFSRTHPTVLCSIPKTDKVGSSWSAIFVIRYHWSHDI